jgi:hypothetical protein
LAWLLGGGLFGLGGFSGQSGRSLRLLLALASSLLRLLVSIDNIKEGPDPEEDQSNGDGKADIVDELEGSECLKKEVECLLDVLESVNLLGQLVLEVTVA